MTCLGDFRVGDRVKIVHGEYTRTLGGETGVVVENNRALFVRVHLDMDSEVTQGWLFWPEDLERVDIE
jgi:hypothetical protein